DEIVEHHRHAELPVVLHKAAAITEHHHIRWRLRLVLRWHIHPPVTRRARIDLRVRPGRHLRHLALRYAFLDLRIGAEDILIILRGGTGKTGEEQRGG